MRAWVAPADPAEAVSVAHGRAAWVKVLVGFFTAGLADALPTMPPKGSMVVHSSWLCRTQSLWTTDRLCRCTPARAQSGRLEGWVEV